MKQLIMSLLALSLGLSPAWAKEGSPLQSIPVQDATGQLSNGSFTVNRFIHKQGQVWAIGMLTGSVSGKKIFRALLLPVYLSEGSSGLTYLPKKHPVSSLSFAGSKNQANTSTTALPACDVLHIAFGPGDLNTLGLHLQIAPVAVDITAEDAPADLICSIIQLTGVVSSALNAVTGLLNTLLGALGGLGG